VHPAWRLASAGEHGEADRPPALSEAAPSVDAGLNAADRADVCTGVEPNFGKFKAQGHADGRPGLQVRMPGPLPRPAVSMLRSAQTQ
jgi:hypothetical protein